MHDVANVINMTARIKSIHSAGYYVYTEVCERVMQCFSDNDLLIVTNRTLLKQDLSLLVHSFLFYLFVGFSLHQYNYRSYSNCQALTMDDDPGAFPWYYWKKIVIG